MPKLPVVRSRQFHVSGQPSQVAGALIPDNTQHPWRDKENEIRQAKPLYQRPSETERPLRGEPPFRTDTVCHE